MKATGIIRKVDELGRIVLPKEIRRLLNLSNKDSIEIFADEDKIVLQKYQPGCLFCNNINDTINYMGKQICKSCLEKMKES